jgi:hypothetical protein
MNVRLIEVVVVVALAAGLAGCEAPPARLATAQSANSGVNLGAVTTPDVCPSDNAGFSADVWHFGNTTPWSENPFLNRCWPN